MLSENTVVKVKKALAFLYDGTCTVTEHQKVVKTNKSTGFQDVVVQSDVPCRLSFKSIGNTSATDNTAASLDQVTKVFLNSSINVKPGSKLTVTQNGVTTEYKSSGEPAFYASHQEIVVEIFKDWA